MSQQMKYMHCKSIILDDDGGQSWHKILHQFLLAFRHRHGPCYLMYIREQSMTQQRNHNMRIESWNWSFTLTSTYHWFALEQTQEHHRYTVYLSRQESCPTPSSPLKNVKRSCQPLVQVYFPYTFQNFETSQFKAWYINLVIPISTEFQNNTETEPKPQIQYRPITRNNTFSYHQKSQCLIKISTSVRLTWSAILTAVLPGATRSLSGMFTLAGAICHTEPAGFLAIHLYVPVWVIRAFSITSLERPARLSGLQQEGMWTTFPQCDSHLEFPEILCQSIICYNCLNSRVQN
mgnify:CR=1 FL=1